MMKHLPHLLTPKLLMGVLIGGMLLSGTTQAQVDTKFRAPRVTNRAWFQTVFEQSDKKVLVVGTQELSGSQPVTDLTRFSRSGILDRSFKPDYDGWADQIADFKNSSLLVLDDDDDELVQISKRGEIINWSDIDGVEHFLVLPDNSVLYYSDGYIYHANSDLEIDWDFAGGQGWIEVDGWISDLQLQGNNVVVAGDFSGLGNDEIGWTEINSIARITQSGWVDNSFYPGDGPSDQIGSLTIQKDGKILLGNSYIDQFDGYWFGGSLIRLNADGSLDTGFYGVWNGALGNVHATSSGKIIATSIGYQQVFGMNSDGEWNNNFHTVYFDDSDEGFNAYFLRGDEFITLNGYFNISDDGVHRFSGNGVRFKQFDLSLSEYGNIDEALPDGDKVVIVGDFTKVNGTPASYMARLTKAGAVDPTFAANFPVGGGYNLQKFSDGSYLLYSNWYGGWVHVSANGAFLNYMNFNDSGFYGWSIIKARVVEDDKIVVNGYYPNVAIGRRNMDGTVDNTFSEANSNEYYESYWNNYDIQPDGKIVFVGYFTSIDGNSVPRGVVRLNADGTIDNTFNGAGSGVDGYLRKVTVLNDGGLFIEGSYTYFNGVYNYSISKLSSTGALIPSFHDNFVNSNLYPYSYDYNTYAFRDGFFKFTIDWDPSAWGLWYINNDGTQGETNFPSSYSYAWNQPLAIQNNQTIYVLDAYFNDNQKSIVKLNYGPFVPAPEEARIAQTEGSYKTFPNPSVNAISFDTKVPVKFSIYGFDGSLKLDGKVNTSDDLVDVSNLQPGRYVIRVNVNGKTFTQHLIKN